MLSFRLFQTGATNIAVIFFRKLLNPSNCIHHLLPALRDTEITSRLSILDPVTVLTATNLSFITPS